MPSLLYIYMFESDTERDVKQIIHFYMQQLRVLYVRVHRYIEASLHGPFTSGFTFMLPHTFHFIFR